MKIPARFNFLFYFLLSLGLFLGCGNPSNIASNEVEFWTMQIPPTFTQYFSDLNQKFEIGKEVKIRWVDIPWSAMESKILTAISANTAPDVVNLNPNFASQLATRNAWLDLEPLVSEKAKDIYLSKIWQANKIKICQQSNCKKSTFAVPWYLTTKITLYNQELLKKANIDRSPKTYQELEEVAKKIKSETGKYAFFISFVPQDSADVLESMVQMGVTLIDSNGKAAFNTPEGIAAFNYWVNLYRQKLLPPEVITQGHRYAIELYQAGEIALLSSGAEFINAISNNAPTIAKVTAAAPQITGKTNKKSVAVMNLAIPRNTDRPEEALNYALYLTNTDNQLAFAKQANVLPSTKEAVNKYLQELEKETNISPIQKARKISALQLQDAEILIPPITNINQLQKIIYENMQSAMLEEVSIKQAVANAEKQWNEINRQ